jgi:hypothetical protein
VTHREELRKLVIRAWERDLRTGSGDTHDLAMTVARAAYRLGFGRGRAAEGPWFFFVDTKTAMPQDTNMSNTKQATTHKNSQKAQEAEQMAAHWLHLGNLASERGEDEKAERHYARAQKHQDAMNRYLGNGDGS